MSRSKKGFNKMIAVFTAICMLAGMFVMAGPPVAVYADGLPGGGSGRSGVPSPGGEGASDPWDKDMTLPGDPYLIRNDVDLAALCDPANSEYWGYNFLQTEDITLLPADGGQSNWTPIGDDWSNAFAGTYNGGGHTISGLTINDATLDAAGLFGYIGGHGVVRDITLENVSITSSAGYAGGLAGVNSGTVEYCDSNGSITGESANLGGLIGTNYGGTVSYSYSTCSITGGDETAAGGLIGYSDSGTVSNNYSTGSVAGGYFSLAGGLIGLNGTGAVSNNYSTGSVTAEDESAAGGLIGLNGAGTVSNNYSTGSVSGGSGTYKGGLIGYNNGGDVTNSYYDRLASGQNDDDKGKPKTTVEMKRQATFDDEDGIDDWNFTSGTGIWRIMEDYTYPLLQWQEQTADEDIALDAIALDWDVIKGENSAENNVTTGLYLLTAGAYGSNISWSSGNPAVIASDGTITRPDYGSGDKTVTLSAIVSKAGGTSQTRAFTLTVKKTPYSDGSNNGGNDRSGSGGTPPFMQDTGGTITAPTPTLNRSTGTASTQINSSQLNAALQTVAPDSAGKKTVEITVPPVRGATGYETSLPAGALTGSGSNTQIQIKTGIADVTLSGSMIPQGSAVGASNVSLTVAQADISDLDEGLQDKIGSRPVIQLTLSIDGEQSDWSNPDAPVTVSIPYTPTTAELANPEGIVVWYIDGSGNAVCVPNGRYDPVTGTVVFDVTHFSDYAVIYNPASFGDVPSGAWYCKAVSFIAARDITTGTGGGNFSPDAKLTRGQFIVVLMKAYEIAPDTVGSGGSSSGAGGSPANAADPGNFSDAGNTYYTGFLAVAKRLGISGGVGGNMFAPDKEITRQEMFTMLYNALKAIGRLPQTTAPATVGGPDRTLSDFSDAGQAAAWAEEAMTLLVETGTVSGSGGKLSPLNTTTRAEMAQVLYNLMAK